jgi:peptide/nickel transport system substrate-binding protein
LVVSALGLLVGASASLGSQTFRFGLYTEPDGLDSAKAVREAATHPIWLLCDALISVSRDGRGIEPNLAESWDLRNQGREAIVKLRPGMILHDGTPLDGEAVRASAARYVNGDKQNKKEQFYRDLIESVEASGLRVTFKLKYPGFHHLTQMDVVSQSPIYAKDGREVGRQCSGPFKFESWVGNQISLVAFPDNWRYGRRPPKIGRVVFQVIDKPSAVVEGFRRSELDYAPILSDLKDFEKVREIPNVTFVSVPALNIYYLGFYTEKAPFDTPAMRKAATQAINVPRMVSFISRGAAEAARGPLAPPFKSYDPTISQPSYDPDAARAQFTRAELGPSSKVVLVYHREKDRDEQVATAVQDALRQVGVTVVLDAKPTDAELFAAIRDREGHMFINSWKVRAAYPERVLDPLFLSANIKREGGKVKGSNFTGYANPAVDQALKTARETPEGVERDRLYREVQQRIVADAPMVFLYHLRKTPMLGRRVKHLDLDPGAHPTDKLLTVELTP